MTIDVHERCEIACEILQRTNDGDDLAPEHLYLLQELVNGNINDRGVTLCRQIHSQVMTGNYHKPWLCGVENLTQDHEGYVYWRGQHVEHYSHQKYEDMKRDAVELSRRCLLLEALGQEVNTYNVIWKWKDGD